MRALRLLHASGSIARLPGVIPRARWEHLDAEVVDRSAIGVPAHPRMGHACDTRSLEGLGRVHLLCKRCMHLARACLATDARVQVLAWASCCSRSWSYVFL